LASLSALRSYLIASVGASTVLAWRLGRGERAAEEALAE